MTVKVGDVVEWDKVPEGAAIRWAYATEARWSPATYTKLPDSHPAAIKRKASMPQNFGFETTAGSYFTTNPAIRFLIVTLPPRAAPEPRQPVQSYCFGGVEHEAFQGSARGYQHVEGKSKVGDGDITRAARDGKLYADLDARIRESREARGLPPQNIHEKPARRRKTT